MIMLSSDPIRFIKRLVKPKSSSTASVANHPGNRSPPEVKVQWPSRSSSGNSFEAMAGPSPVVTPNHSKESNSSADSKSSIASLKHVVGDGAFVFQYKELSKATNSFSPSKKIGNSVYRGATRDHRVDLAISIHKKGDAYTDFVPKLKTLCSVHHINVVSMIGAHATDAGDYVYAVYPFAHGARLRDCLRSTHSPGFCVLKTWTQRLQVAVDVAKGLEYLHHGTNTPHVHKYIKSSNILVDSKTLRAKIAQFGVADLAGEVPPVLYRCSQRGAGFPKDINGGGVDDGWLPVGHRPKLSRSRSRKLVGTRGYMAPEYVKSGLVSAKLDVFAFGVVLLELLSGQESIVYRAETSGGNNTLKRFTLYEGILAITENEDPKSRLRQWMDPLLNDSYPLTVALRAAKLARACIETDPALRPDMVSVAFDLSRILMASERWEANMQASKEYMTAPLEAR